MSLVYLVAGEASGDALGARLMSTLRAQRPELQFAGIGGRLMEAQGLTSLFPMHDLALMGLIEVLPKLRLLRARMVQTQADIVSRRPDIVVTIDSPGFTLRLLKRLAPNGVRTIHYVAPQVWAWRQGRVRSYRGLWRDLLCLLPFEPAFFAEHGLAAQFVGHPVLESAIAGGDRTAFRSRHNLTEKAPILLLLPGSRLGELQRMAPLFGKTLELLLGSFPTLVPVVIAAPAISCEVEHACASWIRSPIIVIDDVEKRDAYAAATAALTKSGTGNLELALAGVPMVVGYRVNPLTAAIARRYIKVPYASLVNLLSDCELVPERIQERGTPVAFADALRPLLDEGPAADAQRAGFKALLARLRPPEGTPSEAAAKAVLAVLDGP